MRGSTLFDLPESAARDEGGRSLRTLGLPGALPALPGALPLLLGVFPALAGGLAGRLGEFAGAELFTEGGRLLLFCMLPWLFCASRRSFLMSRWLFCAFAGSFGVLPTG